MEGVLFCHRFESLQMMVPETYTKILVYTYTLRNSMSHDGLVKSFVFEAMNFYLKLAYIYMTKPVLEGKYGT